MKFVIKSGILKRCEVQKGETEAIIPDGVTVIGDHAFDGAADIANFLSDIKNVAKMAAMKEKAKS